jgi:hypothetical protein
MRCVSRHPLARATARVDWFRCRIGIGYLEKLLAAPDLAPGQLIAPL